MNKHAPTGNDQTSSPSNTETLRYWLALLRAPGIGNTAFTQLLARFGSAQAVFEQAQITGLDDDTRQYLKNPPWEVIDNDLLWLAQANNHLLALGDPAYPPLLLEISDPPPLLFVHGDPAALTGIHIAIVGSRNPTPSGYQTAGEFARHLARTGLTVTSGLALGIDTAAHQGALDGDGVTVAVMGTGLDRVYPAANRDLAYAIAEKGALISEFPPGTPPKSENFPRRNRIISGLATGTLVVEAALRSGSLITARFAMEQGREVFSIPGSIHNPLAKGCHALIRQGAKLVETAADILEELAPLAHASINPDQAPQVESEHSSQVLDAEYTQLLDSMGYDPVSIDVMVERCGLTPEAVSSMLLILELRNIVVSTTGGLYSRISKEAL